MPPRKGKVSQRRSIGPKKKRRKATIKTDTLGESTSSFMVENSESEKTKICATENDDIGWKAAWSCFYVDEDHNDYTEPNLPSNSKEQVDSDKCAADKFYVILHKVFEYSHLDDLDILVKKLRSDHIYTKYILLQNSVNDNRSGWGGLQYMDADNHGLHFGALYRHIQPLSFKLELIINPCLKPSIFVHGQKLKEDHDFWTGLPKSVFTVKDINRIIEKLSSFNICIGNPEPEYVSMLPVGISMYEKSVSRPVAYREDISAHRDGLEYTSTIRSTRCSMLISSITSRCKQCQLYRNTLRKKEYRQKNQKTNSVTLKSTPHKLMSKDNLVKKMLKFKEEKKSVLGELERMKRNVSNIIKSKGQLLSQSENKELLELLEIHTGDVEKSFPDTNSIQRLFWEQQMKYAKLEHKSNMKWHPMVIKWCLYLRSKSQKAYDAARNCGFISLPSSRTLFDYSHVLPTSCGFHEKYTEHLLQEATKCGMFEEDWKSYVGILQDEVKVSQGLVYDKTSGELVGFIELDKIGNDIANIETELQEGERKLATSMLVIMVRGITSSLCYPFICLATSGITAAQLFSPIWETVRILELDCGLKTLFITCDGASPNRKFFRLHSHDNFNNTYWTWNPFSGIDTRRKIYFISDVPHLLKTTRNCFSNSGAHNMARHLWKNGRNILWTHIMRLYEDHVENSLFNRCPKLGRNHIHLTSFTKMKVNLAAQVLSSTVADALEELYGDHVSETVKFIRHMNKFFDCLNCRNLKESHQKRNPNLAPYTSINDTRLLYLTDEFLVYFEDWKRSVQTRQGQYKKSDRQRMTLSHQTLDGLRLSVNSIVECTRFLLLEGADFVLTHRFNQDPLEQHFSHYRHKGGANDNPTVYDVKNTLSQLRVIGSSALEPIRGNITNKRKQPPTVDNTPLAKRKK